jgi:hypothetical protein
VEVNSYSIYISMGPPHLRLSSSRSVHKHVFPSTPPPQRISCPKFLSCLPQLHWGSQPNQPPLPHPSQLLLLRTTGACDKQGKYALCDPELNIIVWQAHLCHKIRLITKVLANDKIHVIQCQKNPGNLMNDFEWVLTQSGFVVDSENGLENVCTSRCTVCDISFCTPKKVKQWRINF